MRAEYDAQSLSSTACGHAQVAQRNSAHDATYQPAKQSEHDGMQAVLLICCSISPGHTLLAYRQCVSCSPDLGAIWRCCNVGAEGGRLLDAASNSVGCCVDHNCLRGEGRTDVGVLAIRGEDGHARAFGHLLVTGKWDMGSHDNCQRRSDIF